MNRSKSQETIPPEVERQLAWTKVKDLINRRSDPGAVARQFGERLHAKYRCGRNPPKLANAD